MERMGDLILTFPLITWLNKIHAGREIWVVGEENFFSSLYKISPPAVYFPWSAAERLKTRPYRFVLNLSHREQAARLAGDVPTRERYGPFHRENGSRAINGPWRLYRAGIVDANRYNLLHWADMNAMDVVDAPTYALTHWPEPRSLGPNDKRVGLFLGASEPEKRPDTVFWAGLVRELLRRDYRPVLFGGPAETGLGREVETLAQAPVLNFCGKLSLEELSVVGQSLQLFITPDTGPMHLAAWTGIRILNLSMGPVNPWETGPYHPGHFVLRPKVSCAGCWRCSKSRLHCHTPFTPDKVGRLAAAIIRKSPQDALRLRLPGLRCSRTTRTAQGLYHLRTEEPPSARHSLSLFWRAFFGCRLGRWEQDQCDAAWDAYRTRHSGPAERFRTSLPLFARRLRQGLFQGLSSEFWRQTPLMLRPAASYLQLLLENAAYGRQAKATALLWMERLASLD
jgi:hypothetical protein